MISVNNQNTIFLIVTYTPDNNLFNLVNEIKRQSFSFIVVDNSLVENSFLTKVKNEFSDQYFIANKNINGISRAYNEGFKLAIKLGYDFVITLDQDSLIGNDLISTFNECLIKIKYNKKSFGAIGVSQNKTNRQILELSKTYELINSGSIISTTAFKNISGYDEHFFIDNVDFDFFLRLNLNGYLTYKVLSYSIVHKLGSPIFFKILFLKIPLNIYPSERLFYYTYSNILFFKKYILKAPFFCLKKLLFFSIYLLKSIFYYNKNEIKSIFSGIKEAIKPYN